MIEEQSENINNKEEKLSEENNINEDPSLPESWKSYFLDLNDDLNSVIKEIEGPSWSKKKITYNEVLKSLKNRDYLDKNRKNSPLKKTKDSILINTSKLSKKACFNKIKALIDKKLKINGSI